MLTSVRDLHHFLRTSLTFVATFIQLLFSYYSYYIYNGNAQFHRVLFVSSSRLGDKTDKTDKTDKVPCLAYWHNKICPKLKLSRFFRVSKFLHLHSQQRVCWYALKTKFVFQPKNDTKHNFLFTTLTCLIISLQTSAVTNNYFMFKIFKHSQSW